MSAGSRHLRFAAAIARRFVRRVAPGRPLALALLRARRPSAGHSSSLAIALHASVRIQPRFSSILVRGATPVRSAFPARAQAGHAGDATRELVLLTRASGERVEHTRAGERVERLVERLLGRGLRLERPPARTATAPPAPLVLLRERHLVAGAPPTPALPESMSRPPLERALAAQVGPSGALDVESLTDRVIAAIDRRVVAETERTGGM
jgi:hypothetical protein